MINKIIAFSIHNKLIVGLLTLVLIIYGTYSMFHVPLDAVPDITNNQVQVITQAPNLGTEDIEQFITYPVEVAVANLPGVVEIRSVSRFGLSVVTIVFDDEMGTYLPRQLVAEKLNEVKEEIPQGFGEPYMGPITTGLGEIYQYTLRVDSEFKDRYSMSDLRTMQDWIVRRQMAMVPGVVEVNAIGGAVKQYEVAVDPDELKAIGLTIVDVFNALEANNQNTGGAYIEKDHQANYIRGEGLARSLHDVENISIKTVSGIPILIRDVAKVQYGKAVRYGALTQDGEEVVGGLVMMLKGANSNEVIVDVKKRMAEIQKSLPEGIRIETLLDRSDLIGRTTYTVAKNLIEGALIVIFVLVVLLGSLRGGLITASIIPLSLFFAFILMRHFNVWANLMSLGAIDFGIIVDGAVIVVEGTVHQIEQRIKKSKKKVDSEEMDHLAEEAADSVMNSAFFGQLIILIVFTPILFLEGVEGKMFRPMAYTFGFAVFGAIILSLTYVPAVSALFLKPYQGDNPGWFARLEAKLQKGSEWILTGVYRMYQPALVKALSLRKTVLIVAVVLFGASVFVFQRMGAEFMPQLDEGDIAFHAILKPGSSLKEMIATTTTIEKILKEQFPEIKKVVSRIGVAEVPTDPMPFDFSDIFVIMAPKSEWVTTDSKDELIEMMKSAVEVVPGVNYEFTQPIEMRFNELLEGVREDIAIKIYGEDIYVLAEKAEEVGKIIAGTPGVADMRVEATTGLPQMTVKYNRYKLAQYGLNVEDLNTVVQSAFAGGKAGVIFEGEKRFDLVVRLDEKHRKSIDDLKNLYVNLPNGNQLPLKEVADIIYQPGPMQISRDNTNRRVYVGINVRGRDIKSLVNEISQKLDNQLVLPSGYYLRYGGAFQNLERATNRLKMVVPLALGLIFVLLYFALNSIPQAIMIYMAVPLAAIGGVFSLWARGMPFSISAGVGFIVLFGVAVLNGLVLISRFNLLKKRGVSNLKERILTGAKERVRPVLLTATAAIMGFLPMAISASAGAEVQRPLATVVIGGLITATVLTLLVVPVLYYIIEKRKMKQDELKRKKLSVNPAIVLLFAILSIFQFSDLKAQETGSKTVFSLDSAISIGLYNNGNIRVAKTNIEAEQQGRKASFNPGKTDGSVQWGQYNSFEKDFAFEINQQFEFPSVYVKQKKLANARITGSEFKYAASVNDLKREIRKAWYQLSYLLEQNELLLFQDSLIGRFHRAATIRYETEATNYLEMATADTRKMEIENSLRVLASDISIQEQQLRILLNDTIPLFFNPEKLEERKIEIMQDSARLANNPLLAFARQQTEIAMAEKSVQSAKIAPDLSLGYFNQSLIGSETATGGIAGSGNRFWGLQGTIMIPIFFSSYKADVQAAKLKTVMAQTQADYYNNVLFGQYEQQLQEVLKFRGSLTYYQDKAVPQADLIIDNAQKSFENGAINYVEYFQNVNQALDLKFNYLNTLNGYNQSIINLEYLVGY